MAFIIKFYEPRAPYGEFSNFLIRSIVVNGVTWPIGTEQFFQAMKTLDTDMQEHIRTKLTRPGQIKNFCSREAAWARCVPTGTSRSLSERRAECEFFSDDKGLVEDRVKDHFMFQAPTAKFSQHPDLAKILLDTKDAYLIEGHPGRWGSDPYWGNGPSTNGLNKLGRMLMLVRKSLPRHLEVATPTERTNFYLDLHECEVCRAFWEKEIETLPSSDIEEMNQHIMSAHPGLQRPEPADG